MGEEYRSLSSSFCSFLHSPVTSYVLSPNFLFNTLFSNTLLTTSVFQNLDENGRALKSSRESREEEMLRTSRVELTAHNAHIYEHFFHQFGRHEIYFQKRDWVAYWLVNAKDFVCNKTLQNSHGFMIICGPSALIKKKYVSYSCNHSLRNVSLTKFGTKVVKSDTTPTLISLMSVIPAWWRFERVVW